MAIQATRKAFRGNIRRAIRKMIVADESIQTWMNRHPDWPVPLLSDPDRAQLHALALELESQLEATYPVGL